MDTGIDDEETTPYQRWLRHQRFINSRETGLWLINRGQPQTGFQYLERAANLQSADLRTVRGQAMCKFDLMEFDAAIKYAGQLLELRPRSQLSKYLSATSLYATGEFEEALVLFHAGNHMFRTSRRFKKGLQKAEETLEYSIGRHAGPILEKLYPTVRRLWAEQRRPPRQAQKEECYTDELAMSMLYLQSLYDDKLLLEDLKTTPIIRTSGNTKRIRASATLGHELLLNKEEIMKSTKPYYLFTRWHDRPPLKKFDKLAEKQMAEIRRRSDVFVQRVLAVKDTNQLKAFMRAADVAITWLKSHTLNWLPDREQLLGIVYDAASHIFLRQKSFAYNHFKPGDENRVARLFLGLPVVGKKAVDVAFEELNKPLLNYRQVMARASEMLKTSTYPAERCYLMNLVAMCASLLGQYNIAVPEARRSADEAHRAGLLVWQLNALMLLFKSMARHGRKVEATYTLDEIEGVARANNFPQILEFIAECRNVLEEPEDKRSPQAIARAREEGLVSMLSQVGLAFQARSVVQSLRSLPFADRVSLPEGFDPVSKLV